jgi:hypothetical protein
MLYYTIYGQQPISILWLPFGKLLPFQTDWQRYKTISSLFVLPYGHSGSFEFVEGTLGWRISFIDIEFMVVFPLCISALHQPYLGL